MFDWNSLWSMLQAAGLPGVVVAVVVLALVYVLSATDLLKNGTLKRLAVAVLSILFAGYQPGDQKAALVAAIGATLATLAKLVIDIVIAGLSKYVADQKAKAAVAK